MFSRLLKILLVEDNPRDAYLIADLLDQARVAHFRLTHVKTLNAAIQQLNKECFDAILLDLSLPDSQGINTLINIQKQTDSLPIVILTVTHNEELAIQAVRLGAQDYLFKGQTTSIWLKRTLSYAIERAQMIQKLRQSEEKLQKLNQQLQELNEDLQKRVEERTKELSQTNEQLMTEIAQRQQLEDELHIALAQAQELNAIKSRILSIVSHEYRTPLTIIFSAAESLEHYGHNWSQQKRKKYLYRIQSNARYMTDLVNEILLIHKAESGTLAFNPKEINLLEFSSELIEVLNHTSEQHTLVFVSQGDFSNACMDEKLLRQILTNLLTNAIKYSPQGGIIKCELICKQNQSLFCIQDQGIGMTTADQEKLFKAFERGENVGNIPGIGLGLAIVKRCVDLHGGNVSVESEIGQGSTFKVTLPLR